MRKVAVPGFAVMRLVSVPDSVQKSEFRANAIKVTKSKIDLERDRRMKTKSDVVARTVMEETFKPLIAQTRHYLRYVAKVLSKYPSIKSDLVFGLASFDYGVSFHLPKPQAIACYRHIFQSFSSRGWLSRELRNVHMDDYVEVVDDVRHIYLDDFGTGPAIDDMVSFLSTCPGLARREYTMHVFKQYCVCLSHIFLSMPKVELGYG